MDVAPRVSYIGSEEVSAFYDLLEEVFSAGSARKVAMFATVAWCLWQPRNRIRKH